MSKKLKAICQHSRTYRDYEGIYHCDDCGTAWDNVKACFNDKQIVVARKLAYAKKIGVKK